MGRERGGESRNGMYNLNRKSKTHSAASLTQRRRRCNRNASAAVELAILLPFLTLMFTAAVDFGRAFYVTQTLEAGIRRGAVRQRHGPNHGCGRADHGRPKRRLRERKFPFAAR